MSTLISFRISKKAAHYCDNLPHFFTYSFIYNALIVKLKGVPMKSMIIAAISASLLLVGCGEDDKNVYVETYPEVSLPVEIAFKAVAGDTTIDCDADLSNLGTANTSAKIADFRFFVHNVRLVLDNGDEIAVALNETDMQTDNIAMLDFRNKLPDGATPCAGENNPNLNKTLVGSIVLGKGLTGEITGLAFTLGVPFSHNHSSPTDATGPLRNPGIASGMTWSWQGGYKFTAFDILPTESVTRPSDIGWSSNRVNFHLGSTGCSISVSDLASGVAPVPCDYPNRTDIVLEGFSFNKVVQLDFAELVSDSNLSEDIASAPGCMSGSTDPECELTFEKLGLVHALSGGDPLHPPTQTVFSLIDL
jgi:uncharacterized repeat protein (TIGR04052 family)